MCSEQGDFVAESVKHPLDFFQVFHQARCLGLKFILLTFNSVSRYMRKDRKISVLNTCNGLQSANRVR